MKWSKKAWARFKETLVQNIGDSLGLNKTKIIFYPFRARAFRDVRKVFDTTAEEDFALIKYYRPYFDLGKNRYQGAINVVKRINQRITYVAERQENWKNAYQTHIDKKGDCDDYAILICWVLRLLGFSENEVFVSVGNVNHFYKSHNGGDKFFKEYHAYVVVFDTTQNHYGDCFVLEGSFYPNQALDFFSKKNVTLQMNMRYDTPDWIVNDKKSYANTKWFEKILRIKMVK